MLCRQVLNLFCTNVACPSILRSDYGTENCNLAAIQIAFRYYDDDSMAKEKSFIYGPSKHNIVRLPYIPVDQRYAT